MPDTNILAGMTPEQADADIAAREAAIERLEATLKGAKDNLKAAKAERKTLQEPQVEQGGESVKAQAGIAEGSGEANA
jgi:multidrug resistance efflux pump